MEIDPRFTMGKELTITGMALLNSSDVGFIKMVFSVLLYIFFYV